MFKKLKVLFLSVIAVFTLSTSVFAASPTDLTDMSWMTAELLSPLVTAMTTMVPICVAVGIAIMAIMIGVSLIPKVVYKFF